MMEDVDISEAAITVVGRGITKRVIATVVSSVDEFDEYQSRFPKLLAGDDRDVLVFVAGSVAAAHAEGLRVSEVYVTESVNVNKHYDLIRTLHSSSVRSATAEDYVCFPIVLRSNWMECSV